MSYYGVTQAFERAIHDSHRMVARLDVTIGGDTTTFDFVDGAVVIDYDDSIRRSLDCEVVDPDGRTFDVMRGLVDPFLCTLQPWRGVKYDDGSTELVPCGIFYPSDVEAGEDESTGAPTWKLRALDTASQCETPLDAPVLLPAGTSVSKAAIPSIIRSSFPRANFRPNSSKFTTPTLIVREEENPWTWSRDLAADFGEDLTADRDGTIISPYRVLRAADSPVWTFEEGANGTSWAPTRTMSADRPVNVVRVIGTNPTYPGVYGEASDLDPKSRTYRYGPMGERRRTFRSERVISDAQATAAAKVLLSKLLGKQDQVKVRAVPNPALDVGDTVAAYRARLGLTGDRMIVSHVELPLVADRAMDVTLRRSVLTDGDSSPYTSAP